MSQGRLYPGTEIYTYSMEAGLLGTGRRELTSWNGRRCSTHREAQLESGLKVERILRNIDDPDEVILLFEVNEQEKVGGGSVLGWRLTLKWMYKAIT